MPKAAPIHACPIAFCQCPENQESRIEGVRLLRLDTLDAATNAAECVLIELQAGRARRAEAYLLAGRQALRVARRIAARAVSKVRP